MINDHQSPMDKMLSTLNEKATYQQCIEGVLTELDKFLNGYSRNIIKFLIAVEYLSPPRVQGSYDR